MGRAIPADVELRVTLRQLRRQRGLPQRALLKPLNVSSHSTIVDYESGRRLPPRDIVNAYERFFELPPGRLQWLRDHALAYQAQLEASATLAASATAGGGAAGPPPGTGATGRFREPAALEIMDSSEAVELLGEIVGVHRIRAEPEAAGQLTARCGWHPLALSIAAGRLAVGPARPLAEAVSQVSGHIARHREPASGDDMATVRPVFRWSFSELTGQAQVLLAMLGQQRETDVRLESAAALTGLTPGDAVAAVRELTAARLLTQTMPGRYQLHEILQRCAAECAQKPRPDPGPRDGPRIGDHQAALRGARARGDREAQGRILLAIGDAYHGLRHSDLAAEYYRQGLEIFTARPDPQAGWPEGGM